MTAPAASNNSSTNVNLRALLEEMIERDASDLHITAGERAKLRVDGEITNANLEYVLTPKDTLQLAYSVLTENQKKRFEMEDELDFSFGIQNLARFRGNCFKQRGCVSMVIRQIPFNIRSFTDLGLPAVIAKMAEKPRGLVLVTGPTGSGKSTTLAAMLDKINKERKGHIITVEDPIEFIHRHQGCIVNQREVGTDTKSFQASLKYALRQDPDVILIGEMRDLDTIQAALTISETGPPCLRHAAHQQRGRSDQPHHRRLPQPSAEPGARAARLRARGDRHADAAAEGEGALAARWRRRSSSSRRRPRAHPRRQDPPDLQHDAVGQEVRHADDERRALQLYMNRDVGARRLPPRRRTTRTSSCA
jgi:energy-coupling factor transporter ATP-binding protein EcfA2